MSKLIIDFDGLDTASPFLKYHGGFIEQSPEYLQMNLHRFMGIPANPESKVLHYIMLISKELPKAPETRNASVRKYIPSTIPQHKPRIEDPIKAILLFYSWRLKNLEKTGIKLQRTGQKQRIWNEGTLKLRRVKTLRNRISVYFADILASLVASHGIQEVEWQNVGKNHVLNLGYVKQRMKNCKDTLERG